MTISSARRGSSLSGPARERPTHESGRPSHARRVGCQHPRKPGAYTNAHAGIFYPVHADETNPGPRDALHATSLGDAPVGRVPEISDRVAMVYQRTADVLEHTAAVAEKIAERQDRMGREDIAEDERRAAERARVAAQRARSLAGERRAPTGES